MGVQTVINHKYRGDLVCDATGAMASKEYVACGLDVKDGRCALHGDGVPIVHVFMFSIGVRDVSGSAILDVTTDANGIKLFGLSAA